MTTQNITNHAREFLLGRSEGYCPVCGTECESRDTDEGTTENHFMSRNYYCPICDKYFTEQYDLVPQSIYTQDDAFYASAEQMHEGLYSLISDIEDEIYQRVWRKRALDDMLAILEANVASGEISENDAELTTETMQKIIAEYKELRYSDWAIQDENEDMKSAIKEVTGLVC